MKKNKKTNNQQKNFFQIFLEKRPLLGYIVLTLSLMICVFLVEQGGRFYQASILNIPAFDGTSLPIERVPDWVKSGGKNDRPYSSYSPSELIPLPSYVPSKLANGCNDWKSPEANACGTYSTVYMGNYRLDHKEYGGSHPATDIRAPRGTPVFAVANGIIEKARYQSSGFGNHIVLRHPNVPLVDGGKDTLYSSYSHLSDIAVAQGDVVKKGDLIGYVGSTGTSTTPHVHFQIDRSSAPYHPWWPFSSTQASAEGLSFFQAINAGLGQKEAKKNTVNPMIWVQAFLESTSPSSSSKTPQITTNNLSDTSGESSAQIPELKRFSVVANLKEVDMEEPVVLIVTAYDTQDRRMTEYSGENFSLTPSTENATVGDILFKDGRATVFVTFHEYGRMGITIRDGDVTNTARVKVLKSITPPVANQNTLPKNNTETIITAQLEADTTTVLVGKRARVTVTLFGEDGEIIKNPNFTKPFLVKTTGGASVAPKKLYARYFTEGKAKIEFYAGKTPGKQTLFLEKFPSQKLEFSVVEKVDPVSSFSIESEGFLLEKKVPVYITTLDAKKKKTLRGFFGKANIKIDSGKAKLSQSVLTREDFTNGVAKIYLTALSKEPIRLSVKAGALVGKSKPIRETKEKKKIFNDVSEDSPYASAIEYLKKKEILSGNPDGTFRPNGGINRAEFAKIMLLALDIDPVPAQGNRFSDVPQGEWYSNYVETAADLGIITGYPDGTFRPNGGINRAEMFAMIARSSNESLAKKSSFVDVPQGEWFVGAAEFAKEKNLLDFGKEFYPGLLVSRGEVAEAISRFLHL